MSSLVEFQIPSAFTANELLNHPDWMIDLTAEEIAEIDIALREHLGSNVEYQDITKSQFPLPCFSTKLSYVLDVIENGIGAVIYTTRIACREICIKSLLTYAKTTQR